MNGLTPWVRAEVECWEPIGLVNMMKVAKQVENRELVRVELSSGTVGVRKAQNVNNNTKIEAVAITNDAMKVPQPSLMRTITLRGVATAGARREGSMKRLSDSQFHLREEKVLCFRCHEKNSMGHRCKVKDQRELRILLVHDNAEELEVFEDANETFGSVELQTATVEETTTKKTVELPINYVVGF